jgi:hypothetical protein
MYLRHYDLTAISVGFCAAVSIIRSVAVGPRSLTRATEQARKSLEKKSACGLNEDVEQLCLLNS